MQVPSFLTEEGSNFYQTQMGKMISPQVAAFAMNKLSPYFSKEIQQVLDVACGPGTVSLTLAEKYPNLRITGIDSSAAMIEKCATRAVQKELTNTQFLVMNANEITLPPSSYHFLICNLAFPFFSQPEKAVQGMNHVLFPEGRAVITAPTPHTFQEFFEIAEELFGETVQFVKPFLIKFGKSDVIASTMEEVGFDEVEVSQQRIPFHFPNGQEVLQFFNALFSLLTFIPDELKAQLAHTIDQRFPSGFTMHFEAAVVQGKRIA